MFYFNEAQSYVYQTNTANTKSISHLCTEMLYIINGIQRIKYQCQATFISNSENMVSVQHTCGYEDLDLVLLMWKRKHQRLFWGEAETKRSQEKKHTELKTKKTQLFK